MNFTWLQTKGEITMDRRQILTGTLALVTGGTAQAITTEPHQPKTTLPQPFVLPPGIDQETAETFATRRADYLVRFAMELEIAMLVYRKCPDLVKASQLPTELQVAFDHEFRSGPLDGPLILNDECMDPAFNGNLLRDALADVESHRSHPNPRNRHQSQAGEETPAPGQRGAA